MDNFFNNISTASGDNKKKIKEILRENNLNDKIEIENEIMCLTKAKIKEQFPDVCARLLNNEGLSGVKFMNAARSAALLELYGFSDLEYIIQGSYNAVFKDSKNKKVYKVCFKTDPSGYSEDQKKNEEIHNLIESISRKNKEETSNEKKKKWIKYLSDAKPVDGIRIFESDLAIGDVSVIKKTTDGKKTLDSFFHKAKNITKCVVGLHEQGISINDLKLANILKMKNDKYDISKEELEKMGLIRQKGEDGKEHWYKKTDEGLKRIHKNFLQISDMGGSTNILEENKYNTGFAYTRNVNPQNEKIFLSHNIKKIAKRDIYPLGIIFLSFLFRERIRHGKQHNQTALINQITKPEKDTYHNLFKNNLSKIYLKIYKKTILEILKLVSKMLSNKLKLRPDYNNILEELKEIEKEAKQCEENNKNK